MLIDYVLASVTIYSMAGKYKQLMGKHKESMEKSKEMMERHKELMETISVSLASTEMEFRTYFLHRLLNQWYVKPHKYCLVTIL